MQEPTQGLKLHGPVMLASAEVPCWECEEPTPVFALMASDLEELEPGEEPYQLESPTFVYELEPEALPPEVVVKLAAMAPSYQPAFSHTTRETSWVNVCVHCSALQGAFFLHNKPGGPFFGGPQEFSGTTAMLSSDGFLVDDATYYV